MQSPEQSIDVARSPVSPYTPSSQARSRSRPPRERTKYVSSACTNCRARRAKCDGGNPCSRCTHSQAQCVYVIETDGRRSNHRKGLHTAVDKEVALMDDLLQLIKTSADDQISDFIDLVQQSTTAVEMRQSLDQWISQQRLPDHVDTAAVREDRVDTRSSDGAFVGHCQQLRRLLDVDDMHSGSERKDSLSSEADGQQPGFRFPDPSSSNAFGNMPASSAVKGGWFPSCVQEQQLRLFQQPVWMLRPMAFNDGSPFCHTYVSFLETAQEAMGAGRVKEVMGGERPKLDLFFRPRYETSTVNVSESACLLSTSFPSNEPIDRLAWLISAVTFMKWLLNPTVDNYNRLGSLRPSIVQLMLPHSASYDLVVSPELRDALCRQPRGSIVPFNNCSVNWHKHLNEAVEQDERDGSLYPTSEFEAHVRDLTNWTFTSGFMPAVPEFQR